MINKLFFILIVTTFFLIFSSPALIHADEVQDKQDQIAKLEAKIASLKDQAQTLSGQIAYYDSQIQLNIIKISQTEDLIYSISNKIRVLEEKLQDRSAILQKQIVLSYKQGQIDPLQLLLSAADFSQFISRIKYTQILQDRNRRFLHDTQVVQSTYGDQKTLLETSKVKLKQQQDSLSALRTDKDNLLKQTQNNEVIYQKQLEEAKLELLAIQQALAYATKEGPVKAGDPIGLVGNSGYPSCSTGKHLHFEVRIDNQWVNSETYLKNITDSQGLNIGSGSWDWPIQGDIIVTQRYGKTPWSYRYVYSGGIHTGVDMVSNSDIIRAPADGTLYTSKQKCGSSDLNVKYIDHGNGLKTFYLHVQ